MLLAPKQGKPSANHKPPATSATRSDSDKSIQRLKSQLGHFRKLAGLASNRKGKAKGKGKSKGKGKNKGKYNGQNNNGGTYGKGKCKHKGKSRKGWGKSKGKTKSWYGGQSGDVSSEESPIATGSS